MIALVLFGFVLVATGVIWRRTIGGQQLREIRRLEQQRSELEAERARLESEIREAQSRGVLAPIVERRLGMHVPPDSLVFYVPRRRTP